MPTKQGGLEWEDTGKDSLKKLVNIVTRQGVDTQVVLSVGEYLTFQSPACPTKI